MTQLEGFSQGSIPTLHCSNFTHNWTPPVVEQSVQVWPYSAVPRVNTGSVRFSSCALTANTPTSGASLTVVLPSVVLVFLVCVVVATGTTAGTLYVCCTRRRANTDVRGEIFPVVQCRSPPVGEVELYRVQG